MNVGDIISGFRVESVTKLPDYNGRLWRMVYEKNGAELVWFEHSSKHVKFTIAFKTLPEDNTGVAHIVEHSVLKGSVKYPFQNVCRELCKTALCTYCNAKTTLDFTYYFFQQRRRGVLLSWLMYC